MSGAVEPGAVVGTAGNGMAEAPPAAPGLAPGRAGTPSRRGGKVGAAAPQDARAAAGRGAADVDAAGAAPEGLELLLWVAAEAPACAAAAKACGVSPSALRQLRLEHPAAAQRAVQLRRLGAVISRGELSMLLRARLAEMLLKTPSVSDLAALLRAFDKLPLFDGEVHAGAAANGAAADPLDGITELDLATAVAEAKRLLEEIDEEDGNGQRVAGSGEAGTGTGGVPAGGSSVTTSPDSPVSVPANCGQLVTGAAEERW